MMQHLATVTTFVCVCGGSLIAKEDRKLVAHFVQWGDMLSQHVVVFITLRFAFCSIVLLLFCCSFCWVSWAGLTMALMPWLQTWPALGRHAPVLAML
jgi:hypothetical protein